MSLWSLLALAGAMLILAITPGPGVLTTVARALASGFSHATFVALGIVFGDLVFLLAAIYGLTAIAELVGSLFLVVKYLGAVYLIWLGIKIWRTPPRGVHVAGVRELSWRANFTSGLVITLGNPKVIFFYLGFLPTFLDLAALTTLDVVIVALVVSMVLGAVMLGYAYAAAKATRLLKRSDAARGMHQLAGGVMVAAGTTLLLKT